MTDTDARPAPAVAWNGQAFLFGALLAAPAVIVSLFDTGAGAALAIGVLPVAGVRMPATRRARVSTLAIGVLAGASIVLGALLAQAPVFAVAAMVALCVVGAVVSVHGAAGKLAFGLCLPLVAIGLSFNAVTTAVSAGAIMVAGAVWAYLVSLMWPERAPDPEEAARAASRTRPPTRRLVGFGLAMGAAVGIAATIGFLLEFDHVGWACAAALLVMRPVRRQLVARSVGRALSVTIGAFAASALMAFAPAPPAIAVSLLLALAAMAATQRSRWYITAAFTTFVAFLVILQADPGDGAGRFTERVLETLLGVGLALVFGALLPAAVERLRRRSAG